MREKKISLNTLFILLIPLISCFLCGFSWQDKLEKQLRIGDALRLESDDYSAVFLSMLPPESYSEGDFDYYLGLTTISCGYRFSDMNDMGIFLLKHVLTEKSPSTIFLGLDIRKIAETYSYNNLRYCEAVRNFISFYINAYPLISYEILLYYPPLSEWLDMDPNIRKNLLAAYRNILPLFMDTPNISLFYTGGEDWLIANPGNYDQHGICHLDVSEQVLLLTVGAGRYLTVTENWKDKLGSLEALIYTAEDSPALPDYSGLSIMFLGDSIIGNYTGSLSIPGAVNGLSQATVYNGGFGGLGAAYQKDTMPSFPKLVDALIIGDLSLIPDSVPAYESFPAFRQNMSNRDSYENVCFFICLGLNDYYGGKPVQSADPSSDKAYVNALRLGIRKLQTSYPEANIILMTSFYTTYFSGGMDIQAPGGGQLTDYVDASLALADELSIESMNNYIELGITAANQAEYLADGAHLNEKGRFLMAKHIVDKLKTLYPRRRLPARTNNTFLPAKWAENT
jgi:lysophospholipase L1-like esterase